MNRTLRIRRTKVDHTYADVLNDFHGPIRKKRVPSILSQTLQPTIRSSTNGDSGRPRINALVKVGKEVNLGDFTISDQPEEPQTVDANGTLLSKSREQSSEETTDLDQNKLITEINALMRSEYHRLKQSEKQAKVSLNSTANRRHPRALPVKECERRLAEIPKHLRALSDMRTLFRALVSYVAKNELDDQFAYMLNVEQLSILDSINRIVKPLNQSVIESFISCIPDNQKRWCSLIGNVEKWNDYLN
ncbi:hypothetical protein M3Y98_00813700 [Aphelenchoides besseyi]|nr:hypothetical protein M3Y98_00813700 [Aphelenchoides besseyi]KAI6212152.1 hypothetical protein M3Y96_00510100 [Aphelenchoides besseyi]